MKHVVLTICLALLLAACSSPVVPSAAVQPVASSTTVATTAPTIVPIAASVTPAPTVIPTATQTTTAVPSATAIPATPTAELPAGALVLARGTLSERPVVVMLDNHPAAYPQSGLDGAVVVFEALAEFGITRYMALFAPGVSPELATIGPVRSARSYFVEWAKGFDAVYVHAGGSPGGLLLAETSIELVNMDGLRGDAGGFFRRDQSREAPHNLFTSSSEISAFAQAATPAPPLDDVGFRYTAAPATSAPAGGQRMEYYFLYADDGVAWTYDQPSNAYLRFRRGAPHIDGQIGEQLRFTNVIVMEVLEAPITGDDKGRIEQEVIGEGRARLFANGSEQPITWQKAAGYAPLRFYGADGVEVALTAGSTWIAAIPAFDNLTVVDGN